MTITPDVKLETHDISLIASDIGILVSREGGWQKRVYAPGSTGDSSSTDVAPFWPIPLPYPRSDDIFGIRRPTGQLDPSGWWADQFLDWVGVGQFGLGPLLKFKPSASGHFYDATDFDYRGWPYHLVPFSQRWDLDFSNQLAQVKAPQNT
jgi:hypothetical protein